MRVWNHNAEKAHKLVDELNTATRTNVFKCVQSNEECVRNADIIITATTAPQPIVQLDWLKKGAHINGMLGVNWSHAIDLRVLTWTVWHTVSMMHCFRRRLVDWSSECYRECLSTVGGLHDNVSVTLLQFTRYLLPPAGCWSLGNFQLSERTRIAITLSSRRECTRRATSSSTIGAVRGRSWPDWKESAPYWRVKLEMWLQASCDRILIESLSSKAWVGIAGGFLMSYIKKWCYIVLRLLRQEWRWRTVRWRGWCTTCTLREINKCIMYPALWVDFVH